MELARPQKNVGVEHAISKLDGKCWCCAGLSRCPFLWVRGQESEMMPGSTFVFVEVS